MLKNNPIYTLACIKYLFSLRHMHDRICTKIYHCLLGVLMRCDASLHCITFADCIIYTYTTSEYQYIGIEKKTILKILHYWSSNILFNWLLNISFKIRLFLILQTIVFHVTIWKNIFTPFYPYVKQCQNNSNTQEKEANKNETLIKITIVLFFILHVIQDLLTFFSHFASQFRLMIIISTWFGHNKYIIAQDVNFWK